MEFMGDSGGGGGGVKRWRGTLDKWPVHREAKHGEKNSH